MPATMGDPDIHDIRLAAVAVSDERPHRFRAVVGTDRVEARGDGRLRPSSVPGGGVDLVGLSGELGEQYLTPGMCHLLSHTRHLAPRAAAVVDFTTEIIPRPLEDDVPRALPFGADGMGHRFRDDDWLEAPGDHFLNHVVSELRPAELSTR